MTTFDDLIIDENYPGLIVEGWRFRLSGEIETAGSLIVRLAKGLVVEKNIEARGRIEAGWRIKAGAGIEAGGSIEAGGRIKAGGRIEAGE